MVVTMLGAAGVGRLLSGERNSVAQAADAAPLSMSATPAAAVSADDIVGVLLAPDMATLSAYSRARVVKVHVRVGDSVSKDQPLVSFEESDLRAELEAAKAAVLSANGAAGSAASEARNRAKQSARGTATPGLLSTEEIEARRAAAESAANQAAAASGEVATRKARAKQVERALAEGGTLRAPFAGRVSTIFVERGVTAQASQPVVRIVGGEALRVRLSVPEERADEMRDHRRARLALDNGQTLWAVLDRASPEVDPLTRGYVAEGDIHAPTTSCNGSCIEHTGKIVHATLVSDTE